MSGSDDYPHEFKGIEPVTEWSEAEKHPGRAISVVVMLGLAGVLIGLGLLVWAWLG